MPGRVPSEQEVLGYFDSCSNWGKWGTEDQMGTLNYITPQKRLQAVALAAEGISIGCSRPLQPSSDADVTVSPLLHYMVRTGERWAGQPTPPGVMQASSDFIGMVFHTFSVTHIDALCHVFRDGKMYNGVPAEQVTAGEKAAVQSVETLRDGIVTRGVLLDVARARGVKWLERGEGISPEDLEEAERNQAVQVGPGDALLIRTGALRRRNEEGPVNPLKAGWPGLHGACVPWLHQRQVAVLGGDVGNDVHPSGYPNIWAPVHEVGIVGMGLWLIDNANVEELTEACQRLGRWQFLFMVGPLRFVGGTGSPVNPIAVL